MILNYTEYNPLKTLFKYDLSEPSVDTLNLIQYELFKGGVVPETPEEFGIVLNMLVETEKAFYGKK